MCSEGVTKLTGDSVMAGDGGDALRPCDSKLIDSEHFAFFKGWSSKLSTLSDWSERTKPKYLGFN